MFGLFKNTNREDFQVICHRGLCTKYPENTRQAILGAIQTADLAELDILLTKDEEIIVFHDRTLDRITNISDFPQFGDRFKQETIDDYGLLKWGHWVRDFTLDELKKLRVHQPNPKRPQLKGSQFVISTMEEIIEACLKYKQHNPNNKGGLLIELKSQAASGVSQGDKVMCGKLVDLLCKYELATKYGCAKNRFPVVIQSFNLDILQHLSGCQNEIIQLYDEDVAISQQLLTQNRIANINISGIGVGHKNMYNPEGVPSRHVRNACDKMGYSLKYWTVIDDTDDEIPFGCSNYREVYLTLARLGVTGFITEFPQNCYDAIREYCGILRKQSSYEEKEERQILSSDLEPQNISKSSEKEAITIFES